MKLSSVFTYLSLFMAALAVPIPQAEDIVPANVQIPVSSSLAVNNGGEY